MPVPLVLLPGMGCSARLWGDVVDELRAGPSAGRPRPVVVRQIDRPTLDEQVDALDLHRLPGLFEALGEFLAGEYIERTFRRTKVWIPAKDSGVDRSSTTPISTTMPAPKDCGLSKATVRWM